MKVRQSLVYDIVFFVALLTTALALGAALAHVLELPNKINLPEREYFIVQQVYRGWNQLAFLLTLQLVSMLALAFLSRHEPRIATATLVAVLCFLSAQAVFWLFTYPTNVATENWTTVPSNWAVLRAQWEYSHAVGAAFQMLALASLIVALLARAHVRSNPSHA